MAVWHMWFCTATHWFNFPATISSEKQTISITLLQIMSEAVFKN